ncbi:MAG: hypothetical protein ACQEQ0_03685 [Bacteroidota bacterium]
MKKILFGFVFLFALSAGNAFGQCDQEALLEQALDEMGDGQYIKDFVVELDKGENESKTGYVKYSVILNSQSQYKFNVVNADSNTEDVQMQLYDGDKLLANNRVDGEMREAFGFICRSTKVYKLVFSFRGGEEGCARAVLSLTKQLSEDEM